MSKIEIKEAHNGWIIEVSGETRNEPRVFEMVGSASKFRTTLEERMDTAARALTHVLNKMIGSIRYRVIITEDTEDAQTNIPVVAPVPGEAFSSGLSSSG